MAILLSHLLLPLSHPLYAQYCGTRLTNLIPYTIMLLLCMLGGKVRAQDAKWGGIEVWGEPGTQHEMLMGDDAENLTFGDYVSIDLSGSDPGMVLLQEATIENGNVNTIITEQDYKAIGTAAFELSPNQYAQLRAIADAKGSQAPTACTLLSLLRGEYCEWTLPDIESGKRERKGYPQVSLIDLKANNRLVVQPNPTQGQAIVNIPPYLLDAPAYLQVFDVSGKLLYDIALVERQISTILDTDTWQNGVYVLSLMSGEVRLAQAKLVVQH